MYLVVITYKQAGIKARPVWQVIDKTTAKVLVDDCSTVEYARTKMAELIKQQEEK